MPAALTPPDEARIRALIERLPRLSPSQLLLIENIIAQFERSADFNRNPRSDLVSDCVLREFSDVLRIHHCFSSEAFTKDKFEYALEKTCNVCGLPAERAKRGNRGHDITIRGVPFSLKTQADTAIKDGYIHISKFMELGRGKWSDNVEDLAGLRTSFFHHMRNYKRILTLRRLKLSRFHFYELVEIPKALLLEAEFGELRMAVNSKQFPKPGTCTVNDEKGRMKFQLYFDGGTERKLQVRRIDKNLCIVHATWKFQEDLVSEE
jgi:hypothetical protein